MSRIIVLLAVIFMSKTVDARLMLKISMIYKNGIDKNLVLESELHSIEEVWGKRQIQLTMKNGARLELSAGFWERPVAKITEVGPSSKIYFDGRLIRPNGVVAKQVERRHTHIDIGEVFIIDYRDKGQLLEVSITPFLE